MIRQTIASLRSSKTAIPILVMMVIVTQSFTSISQAWTPDPYPDYTLEILPSVQKCNVYQYPITETNVLLDNGTVIDVGTTHTARDPLKWWLNCFSYHAFGTPKLVPIFFNLALMPLVYLLARELTKDRIISLLSIAFFVNNPLYNNWISSGTYDQTWSFFLILSIFVMFKYKTKGLPVISFMVSLSAKAIGLLYLPAWFYTYYKSNHSKTETLIIIGGITALFIILAILEKDNLESILGGTIGLHMENLHSALFDNLGMLVYEIPFLMIFGYLSWKYPPKQPSPFRKLCAIWIINSWLTTTLIYLFSTQFQFVYRFVPLAVFMSLFIAITINDLGKKYIEYKLEPKTEN